MLERRKGEAADKGYAEMKGEAREEEKEEETESRLAKHG